MESKSVLVPEEKGTYITLMGNGESQDGPNERTNAISAPASPLSLRTRKTFFESNDASPDPRRVAASFVVKRKLWHPPPVHSELFLLPSARRRVCPPLRPARAVIGPQAAEPDPRSIRRGRGRGRAALPEVPLRVRRLRASPENRNRTPCSVSIFRKK